LTNKIRKLIKNITIKSSNEAISKPDIKILKTISKVEDSTNIETWTIEVIYNCNKNNPGIIDVIMTVSPDHCVPFNLYWKKNCKETSNNKFKIDIFWFLSLNLLIIKFLLKLDVFPNINIGITPKGNEVIKSGKWETNSIILNRIDAQNKLTLSKDMHSISFYVSYAEEGVNININRI